MTKRSGRTVLAIVLALSFRFAASTKAQTGGPALDPAEEAKIAKMVADSGAPSVSIAIETNSVTPPWWW